MCNFLFYHDKKLLWQDSDDPTHEVKRSYTNLKHNSNLLDEEKGFEIWELGADTIGSHH